MTIDTIRAQIKEEYDQCIHFVQYPHEAPELFGVPRDRVGQYYAYRAEGLGFALDRIERYAPSK